MNWAHALTGLLTIPLLLYGCSSKATPSGPHFPITNGFHTSVPTTQQHILILGNPLLTHIAGEWLTSHHYVWVLLPREHSYVASNQQAPLTIAAEHNSDIVLLLEQEEQTEGALIEPRCRGLFKSIRVSVRGLSVESRETILRGSAHYPHCVEHSDIVLQHLTCQALATAWGFRPTGQLEIPSHLACTAGQTTPTPTH